MHGRENPLQTPPSARHGTFAEEGPPTLKACNREQTQQRELRCTGLTISDGLAVDLHPLTHLPQTLLKDRSDSSIVCRAYVDQQVSPTGHSLYQCLKHISDIKDIEEVIENSKKAGLLALLAVAEHAGEFEKIIALSQRFPGFIFPCLGVHPVQEVSPEHQRSASLEDLGAALPVIEKYKDHLVAIGEVGLDFTPRYVSNETDKESQRQVLIRQAQIAKELDLPLNVHSRSAGRPTIHLLKEQGVEKALLHAFDGKPSVAMEGVKAGYFFSIPPSIIRSEQKQKLVKQLPLENICLETDSPALGPEKQVRNEPQNISIAAEYISKIKGVSLEKVVEVTTQNALRLFSKLKLAIKP